MTLTEHKQRNFVGQTTDVFFQCDEGIYQLISSMTRYGVKTLYSCEGNTPELVKATKNDHLFDYDPSPIKRSRAYVMFKRDRIGDKFISAAIGYFLNYTGPLNIWAIDFTHTKRDGDRVTLYFPNEHIMRFSSYIETVLGNKKHQFYPH